MTGLLIDSLLSKLIKDLFPFQASFSPCKAGAGGTFPSPPSQVGAQPPQWLQTPGEPMAAAASAQPVPTFRGGGRGVVAVVVGGAVAAGRSPADTRGAP